jgi:hypothetical protein
VTEDLVELVGWMQRECAVNWNLLAAQDVDDKVGNGFTVVIEKIDPDPPTRMFARMLGSLRARRSASDAKGETTTRESG